MASRHLHLLSLTRIPKLAPCEQLRPRKQRIRICKVLYICQRHFMRFSTPFRTYIVKMTSLQGGGLPWFKSINDRSEAKFADPNSSDERSRIYISKIRQRWRGSKPKILDRSKLVPANHPFGKADPRRRSSTFACGREHCTFKKNIFPDGLDMTTLICVAGRYQGSLF